MKISFSLLFLVILLSSCFEGIFSSPETTSQAEQISLVVQDKGDFSISIPSNWKTLPLTDLPVPKTGEVVFAVSSPEQRQGYINNIVILKAENTLKESSQALMKNSGNFLDSNLQSYAVKKEETLVFQDEEEGILLTFLGKYNSQTPEVTYLQTARACGDTSYFLTLSVAEQLESYDRYAALLKTFSCKE